MLHLTPHLNSDGDPSTNGHHRFAYCTASVAVPPLECKSDTETTAGFLYRPPDVSYTEGPFHPG
jgi:hypothetical protein